MVFGDPCGRFIQMGCDPHIGSFWPRDFSQVTLDAIKLATQTISTNPNLCRPFHRCTCELSVLFWERNPMQKLFHLCSWKDINFLRTAHKGSLPNRYTSDSSKSWLVPSTEHSLWVDHYPTWAYNESFHSCEGRRRRRRLPSTIYLRPCICSRASKNLCPALCMKCIVFF